MKLRPICHSSLVLLLVHSVLKRGIKYLEMLCLE